jgi:hypothetical protein
MNSNEEIFQLKIKSKKFHQRGSNELGEVIQNGAEKRKSRDQDREDIIKSLIIIYIYI